MSDALTLLNDRVIWLLDDTPATRRLIGRYIDVWEYPDGRLEIRADGVVLPCVPYDKLAEIDQGAVIEHKRLGHALQVAQALQAQRDNRRTSGSPSRTNRGAAVRKPKPLPGTKKSARIHASRSGSGNRAGRAAVEDAFNTWPAVCSHSLNGLTRPCLIKAVLRHYVDSNR